MNNLEYFKTLKVEDVIKNIKNDSGNAFISLNENLTGTDKKIIGIKDIHNNKGSLTTAASNILSEGEDVYDSTVAKLLKENDFSIVGNLNLDEFAMGGENENSYFGGVDSALNSDYYAGGSSGGSAYAVSKGLIPVATGTDTGGSIRQPAALNGVYGLKPTYGLISRYGTVAFASSFDTVGVISNTIEDNIEVLKVLAKNDENDQTNYVPENFDPGSLINKNEKFKIAYIKEWIDLLEDETVKNEVLLKIQQFKEAGYEVNEVSIPTLKYSLELYIILAYSEASSNLSRYDGIRFGKLNDTNVFDKHRKLLGDEVKKRLVIGAYMTSSNHSKEFYQKAQQIRAKMIKQFNEVFKDNDIVIGPTTPNEGINKYDKLDSKYEYLYDFFLIPANLTGVPSMSVPIKKLDNNMSISLQVLANKYDEAKIYNIAKVIENWRNNE